MFGSMLQKSGVRTDLYGLCNIDLKDFSLQGKSEKLLVPEFLFVYVLSKYKN